MFKSHQLLHTSMCDICSLRLTPPLVEQQTIWLINPPIPAGRVFGTTHDFQSGRTLYHEASGPVFWL